MAKLFRQQQSVGKSTPATNVIAGTDQSCPNTGSIACLLLTAIGTEEGQQRAKSCPKPPLSNALTPKGGSAPSIPLPAAWPPATLVVKLLLPYIRRHFFYRAANKRFIRRCENRVAREVALTPVLFAREVQEVLPGWDKKRLSQGSNGRFDKI